MVAELIEPVARPLMRSIEVDAPRAGFGENLKLFGQFVGNWKYETQYFLPDGTTVNGEGEIHFGWILGGTAVQDTMEGVIRNPPPGFPKSGNFTGVRFYDPTIDAWQVVAIAPSSRAVQRFTARQVGDEIVLEGKNDQGFIEHWIFSEITHDSWHWRALESRDNGKTWHLDQRIWAVRISLDK